MIEAVVKRGGEVIMQREFSDSDLSMEMVLMRVEGYVIGENLNAVGDCDITIRRRQEVSA